MNWLSEAAAHFAEMRREASTRWQAERAHEMEVACRNAMPGPVSVPEALREALTLLAIRGVNKPHLLEVLKSATAIRKADNHD